MGLQKDCVDFNYINSYIPEKSNSRSSYNLIRCEVKMRILSSLLWSLMTLKAGASEITINNYDKEIYCPVKTVVRS